MEMQTRITALKTLVVDDSRSQREYLKAICVDAGLKSIREAENGIAALRELSMQSTDVVFVDLEMPEMDGIELLRKIAQVNHEQAIVILSSKDPTLILSVGTMAEADGLKVLGTYQKPIQVEQVYKSLDTFFNYQAALETPDTNNNLSKDDITRALENEEFYLAYQPKMSVDGSFLRSAEALARWKHPSKGNISPIEFIALSEKHELILPLTLQLLDQALCNKRAWKKQGIFIKLAFNLSPLSLADKSIVKSIQTLMGKYNIQPTEIIFEVTETALHKEMSNAIETLAVLRMRNFHIAIDDYGTGFANAQQLSRVPATELKIDRSLIHNVALKPQQQTILRNTVALAKDLSLLTVAEGVETEADLSFVRDLDVDLVQGFVFSKPLRHEEFLTWVEDEFGE